MDKISFPISVNAWLGRLESITSIDASIIILLLRSAAILTLALFLGWVTYRLTMRLLSHMHRLLPEGMGKYMVARLKRPALWLNLTLAVDIAVPLMLLPDGWLVKIGRFLVPITVAVMGWNVVAAILAIGDWSRQRFAWMKVEDNLAARRISTQAMVMVRVAVSIAVLLTAVGIAMTIPGLRTLGVSLFASAGVAGLAVGMAARPALSNMLAGIQLAFTQPIRLDDVVIVEGEWGRVEEITSTFVVVRIWDLRQLIVPLTYFIEKPFQNWTHSGANLLGTVFIYVDYTVPVEAVRREVDRILEESPLWDKAAKAVQVTDAKEQTLEVRILVSASNSSKLFDLRCIMREKIIDFLQREYPHCLPKRRNDVEASPASEEQGVLPFSPAAPQPQG